MNGRKEHAIIIIIIIIIIIVIITIIIIIILHNGVLMFDQTKKISSSLWDIMGNIIYKHNIASENTIAVEISEPPELEIFLHTQMHTLLYSTAINGTVDLRS